MKIRWWIVLIAIISLSLLLLPGVRSKFLSGGISQASKGYLVAKDVGCFTCHGPNGAGGVPNPGAQSVPAFLDFTFLMSVTSEADLDGWILDGAPASVKKQPNRALVMPAYRDRLSSKQYADLKFYYKAVSGIISPHGGDAEKGFQRAKKLGCFTCHGEGGRLDVPNPGSLVGRIPAWSGPDYRELVQDEQELDAWILDGAPARLKNHAVASFFMNRAQIKMPAYRDLISDEDLKLIKAYINWLRQPEKHREKYGDSADMFFDF